MPLLVDFHTHFFSRTVFDTFAAGSPLKGGPAERTERVVRAMDLTLPPADPFRHMQSWLAEMERHGISHLVSFASVPEEVPVLLEIAARSQGRISAFATVDPTRSDAAARLGTLLEQGRLRGAVLFPALHRYRLDGHEAAAVFEVLEAHDAPAVVHCGLLRMPLRERFGLARELDFTCADPLALVRAADRYPGLPFVVPHFGAGLLRETLLLGAQCGNVHVDTSSSHAWLATQPGRLTLADVFERALGVFGPERILFGTDSSVFPRGWRRDLLLAQREALGACGVREEDRARIFGMNAARLLRLG
jgi:uncharacterized protein